MRTINDIISSARNALQKVNSPLASFSRYSNIYAMLRSVAHLVAEQDFKIKTARDSFYVFSATGEDLDHRALDFGLFRKQGTFASGSVLVESNLGNNLIPQGTILTTADSSLQFEVIAETFVGSAETTLPVRSLTKSLNANLAAGTRLYSSFYPSVKFTVGQYRNSLSRQAEGAITGGRDLENDDLFKDRILRHLQSLGKGTVSAIEAAIMAIPGITRVFIRESAPAAGYVTAYINSQDTRVMDAARIALQMSKCAGVAFLVESIETTPVNINLIVRVKDFADSARITARIKTLLTHYFDSLDLGQVVDPLTLNALVLSIEGVTDSQILEPTNPVSPLQYAGLLSLANLNISLQQ